MTKNKLCSYAATAWGFLVILLCGYTDLAQSKVVEQSDYLTTFHTAGYLVAHNRAGELYAPEGAKSFAGAPFDKASHEVLKLMPAWMTSEYMYMPLSACVFAPFSFLLPKYSLLAWQVLSFAALMVSAFLISTAAKNKGLSRDTEGTLGWYALTFLPLVFNLWIGQAGLVFGLAPLAIGFYFLLRGQPVRAGIAWSLTAFKPQYLVPVAFILTNQLAQKKFQAAASLGAGLATIAALNLLVFGPGICHDWLATVSLSDRIFSDVKQGVVVHLATSLPRTFILMFQQHLAIVRPAVYLVAVTLLAAGLACAARLSTLLKNALSSEHQICLAMILGILAAPLVVPHLFFYDLLMLALAGILVYAFFWESSLESALRLAMTVIWCAVNIYAVVMVCHHEYAQPLALVTVFLFVYMRMLLVCRGLAAKGHVGTDPVS